MWLITTDGFYSVVEKPEDRGTDMLTIRARVASDLDRLRERFLPTLGATGKDGGTDYKFRARAPRKDIADAMSKIAMSLDYSNFKSAVAKRQGKEREQLYHGLWNVLLKLQTDPVHNKK